MRPVTPSVPVLLLPHARAGLKACAARWDVSVEEAARILLEAGLERLQTLDVPPWRLFATREHPGEQEAVVRFCTNIILAAVESECRVVDLRWSEEALSVTGRRRGMNVSLWPPEPRSHLSALYEDLHRRGGFGDPRTLWLRFCWLAEMPLHDTPGLFVGTIYAERKGKPIDIRAVFRIIDETHRNLRLVFAEQEMTASPANEAP